MTSKGLTKDAVGLKKLSKSDIKNIELGKHKYNDDEDGIEVRIRTLFNEFRDDNPNGKTILQRIEHLKAGSNIYQKNPIFGIGSGDIQDEFDRYYEATNSKLLPENRLRTHNQIFTYFITFGLVGGLLFLSIFFLAYKHFFKTKNLLAILFTTIILLSFLSEDTLETQMGGTFFALFFGLFISLPDKILKDEN
jgi:O-antigen ligase